MKLLELSRYDLINNDYLFFFNDSTSMVQISDSVVRRLKGEIEQERDREAKTTHKPVSQSGYYATLKD